MQAIELDAAIVKGEIHAKLPMEINAEKVRLIVLYDAVPPVDNEPPANLLQLLDNISSQRNWPLKSKAEIDNLLDEERAAWD